MTFRVPKKLVMVAGGTKVKQIEEGDYAITEWQSRGENTVAGFNLGNFKSEVKKLAGDFDVEAHANKEVPDMLKAVQTEVEQSGAFEAGISTINTTSMLKKTLAEAELAVGIYRDYFGPTSFKRVSMTQQTAIGFGQAWPEMVYLPISSFFDGTVRHQLLGFDPHGYFKVVGPHEVAHQWWGHAVGWNSYRDQWMSEGFSNFSASLFLQQVYGNKQFLDFLEDEKKALTEKNRFGFRAIDVGPLTMGRRLANDQSGFDVYRRLIYPKGGFVLHMLRMMMWTPQKQDERFKAMMRDFVASYPNKAASTEDFKAAVEKHMTDLMDLDGNKRMDWFFNQFVYGTALPNYTIDYSFAPVSDGVNLRIKVTQSNVTENFKMLVPLYVELADNRIMRLGSANITGNSTFEQEIPLKGLKQNPKRAVLNYYYDVLSTSER
jgi:hypothetical protein